MSLADKARAVAAAEAACALARAEADASFSHLKSEIKRGATPVRIVVSGLVLGFASGMKAPSGTAGKLLGGPLLSLVTDTLLPSMMAGFTAAQAAAEQVEESAGEVADDIADQVVEQVAEGETTNVRARRA